MTENPMELKKNNTDKYGVIAEVEGHQRQLVLLNLPFGRLIDEIVIPYDNDAPFFVDGVSVNKKKIRRIKIVVLNESFHWGMEELENGLIRRSQEKKIYGDQYETRFEHVLRTRADDVTAQVLKAYNVAVKPRMKDYIPKREEIISAATTIFVEAMKALSH